MTRRAQNRATAVCGMQPSKRAFSGFPLSGFSVAVARNDGANGGLSG